MTVLVDSSDSDSKLDFDSTVTDSMIDNYCLQKLADSGHWGFHIVEAELADQAEPAAVAVAMMAAIEMAELQSNFNSVGISGLVAGRLDDWVSQNIEIVRLEILSESADIDSGLPIQLAVLVN